jgi:arylsulfatase A-like enzyme
MRIPLSARCCFRFAFALFVVTMKAGGADTETLESRRPAYNFVFIALTNTRADHLGTYGYQRNTSPRIDAFARQSIVFKNAFTHASWTLPVAISLFTSQYPFQHRLMNRDEAKALPASERTFAEVLKDNGYTMAAFVGDRDYSQNFGHTSRFHLVVDPVNQKDLDDWHRYGVLEKTMPPARSWLRENKDKRFFMLVQGYDTHCPFSVPKENAMFSPGYRGKIDFTRCYWTFEPTRPIRRRSESGEYHQVYLLKTKPTVGDDFDAMFYPADIKHMIALYDGEIFNADKQIGELLDDIKALGLEKNTIVVFYSDHGDMFGKHGRFMRGGPLRGTFYDDVLHIPLIVRHPALAPREVTELAQVIDIPPTLLEMAGLASPPQFVGKSLVPMMKTNTPPLNEYVFAGSAFSPSDRNQFFRYPSVIASARSKQWKLIVERVETGDAQRESIELYNLKQDSEELTNVAEKEPAALASMKAAMRDWLRNVKSERMLPGL